nr:hypothetical protein [Candidatus Freyarchaeota archaeon]
MSEKVNSLMDRVKSSMSWKTYLALMDEDGKILYTNFNEGLNDILKRFAPALKTLDAGDYQVKNFAKTRLVTFKVTDRLALIAESYAKEGLLIFTLRNIAEKLKDEFVELDLQLMFSELAEEESEASLAKVV